MIICAAICIAFACMAVKEKSGTAVEENSTVLKIWQIDGFEGGKGSRADYLQKTGNEFGESFGCYVNVISLSSEAARLNMEQNNLPDIISYAAGMYGIQDYLDGYETWCRGGYCLLTLGGDFSDVSNQNTVINSGKENFARAAALMCGLNGCKEEKPTGAYLKLIDNQYKYLLGTQRDIYRLKTRGVSFSVKPITEYNDLYQNISVITSSAKKDIAEKYIEYLLSKSEDVIKLGLLNEHTVYDDEMKAMTDANFDFKLCSSISSDTRKQIENSINGNDINMLKSLLK